MSRPSDVLFVSPNFNNPRYLSLVERKFGFQPRRNVKAMAGIKLRRKLLETSIPIQLAACAARPSCQTNQ